MTKAQGWYLIAAVCMGITYLAEQAGDPWWPMALLAAVIWVRGLVDER